MSHPRPPVLRWFRYAMLLPVLALTAACGAQVDEQVTIDDCDTGASAPPAASSSSAPVAPSAPSASAGGGASDAGAPTGNDAGDSGPPTPGATDGGSNPGDAGAAPTGQSLSTGPTDFCVVAPWTDSPQQFVSSTGATTLPGGTYTLRYVGGAQNHDEYHLYGGAYEVTAHYPIDGLEAGHHLYDGADPYSSTTSVWLDASGLVGDLPDVASVEKANAGHTWPITLAGGPLYITYYDNDYSDNIGPGTQLCIDTSAPSGVGASSS